MLFGGGMVTTSVQSFSDLISLSVTPTPIVPQTTASPVSIENFKQLCLFGIGKCPSSIIPNQEVGRFLSWPEALTIVGISFALIQLLDSSKLRTYIFRSGPMIKATLIAILLALGLSFISTFLPFLSINIPILGYPATYELIALTTLSVWLTVCVYFIYNPMYRLFMPKFDDKLIENIRNELLLNQSDESLSAFSRIINYHLKQIIQDASQFKPRHFPDSPPNNPESEKALDFIDVDLSGLSFVTYVGLNHLGFVTRFIKLARKNSLWEAGGRIFTDNLCEVLFTNENSLLTKELKFGGLSGVIKPLSNLLFTSLDFVGNYRIFQSFNHRDDNISMATIENWTTALEISLKEYFSHDQDTSTRNSPSLALNIAVVYLSDTLENLVLKIYKQGKEAIWDNEYHDKISVIATFFDNLQQFLLSDNPESEYKPTIGSVEMSVADNTVTKGIVKAMFNYLEAFALIEEEDFARFYAIRPMWIIFDDKGVSIFDTIRDKIRSLIEERFIENYKGNYHSMIKLILNIYGGAVTGKRTSSNSILNYAAQEFQSTIAPRFLIDEKFRTDNLPSTWTVNIENRNISREIYGKTELLYKQ